MIEEMLMKELMKTAAHTRRPFRPHGEGRRLKPDNAENNRSAENRPECGHGHFRGRPEGCGHKQDMGAHFRLLDLLSPDEGISQQAIADRLGIRPQSVSEALTKLDGHGLIRKEESADDKRVTLVYLSDRGAEQRKAFCEARAAHAEKFFSPLTEEEKQTLLGLLTKLNASKDAE